MNDNCTHGGDCQIHPDAGGLHNYDPTVEDVLRAVLAKITQRRGQGEQDLRQIANDIRQIAVNAGVTL